MCTTPMSRLQKTLIGRDCEGGRSPQGSGKTAGCPGPPSRGSSCALVARWDADLRGRSEGLGGPLPLLSCLILHGFFLAPLSFKSGTGVLAYMIESYGTFPLGISK